MSESRPDLQTWAAGLLFLGLAGFVGYSLPRPESSKTAEISMSKDTNAADKGAQAKQVFTPPRDDEIPDDDFGKMIRLGSDIFHDTQKNAKEFVGNALQCANCHIDRGRLANSAPLWAAYVAYPAFRDKDRRVNTFQERVQGCFRYSMNGKAPPLGDNVLVAIETYAYFLAKGAPTGVDLPGRGYPKLPKPASLDYGRGEQVYLQKCAVCHGATGQDKTRPSARWCFRPCGASVRTTGEPA